MMQTVLLNQMPKRQLHPLHLAFIATAWIHSATFQVNNQFETKVSPGGANLLQEIGLNGTSTTAAEFERENLGLLNLHFQQR